MRRPSSQSSLHRRRRGTTSSTREAPSLRSTATRELMRRAPVQWRGCRGAELCREGVDELVPLLGEPAAGDRHHGVPDARGALVRATLACSASAADPARFWQVVYFGRCIPWMLIDKYGQSWANKYKLQEVRCRRVGVRRRRRVFVGGATGADGAFVMPSGQDPDRPAAVGLHQVRPQDALLG